jgi:hypothetical protein
VALEYGIDRARRLITITGDYSAASEWESLIHRVAADPGHEPGYAVLRDLRHAAGRPDVFTVFGIIEVLRRAWPTLQPTRLAFLAAEDVELAAVAHAIAQEQHLPIRAFTSPDAALRWLKGDLP